MQTLPTLLLAAVVSTTCALTAVSFAPRPAAPTAAPLLEDPSDELDALRSSVAELERRLEKSALITPVSAPARVAASSEEPLDADALAAQAQAAAEEAIRRLVKSEALALADSEALAWPGENASVEGAVRAILDAGIDTEAGLALWAEAAENGQLHDLLAAMEAELEGVPESADKHFDRGRAYYAAARAFPENRDGNWWVDSDNAFSQALEHDPEHWDARYQKAVHQSFWPTAYGGQAKAIRQFETLVEQQQQRDPQERESQVYVWLGNLYDQQGRSDEARAMWERGLARHPGDSWLTSKLAE